jgi:hypothetical protein
LCKFGICIANSTGDYKTVVQDFLSIGPKVATCRWKKSGIREIGKSLNRFCVTFQGIQIQALKYSGPSLAK